LRPSPLRIATARWLRWSASPDNEHGLIYAIARAVTEQREAAAALQVSEARFREITQNVPGAVFQFTVRNGIWTIDFISERIQEIAGVSAAEVIQDIAVLNARVHPEDLDACTASVVTAVERFTPWMFEGRYLFPDGSIRWWQGTSATRSSSTDSCLIVPTANRLRRRYARLRFSERSSWRSKPRGLVPGRGAGGQPGQFVRIAVADTGSGMSEEVKRHLFEPFFTPKAPGKAVGLGLATCFTIMKQYGGSISIDGAPGQGATVTVYFSCIE
jgi:PAS domain-containing protein